MGEVAESSFPYYRVCPDGVNPLAKLKNPFTLETGNPRAVVLVLPG